MHEWNKADLKLKWNWNEIDMKLNWNWSEDLWILIVQWIHIIKIWSVMISSRLFRSKTKIAHRMRFLTSRVFLVPLWSTTYCRTIYVFSFIYCLACSPTCDLARGKNIVILVVLEPKQCPLSSSSLLTSPGNNGTLSQWLVKRKFFFSCLATCRGHLFWG